ETSLKEDIIRVETSLKGEIAKYAAESKADVVRVETSLKSAILELKTAGEILESRMDRQFLKIDQRYNWIISIIVGTGFTILFSLAGMIAKGFHWF
ncbi:MAG: hypothetical protein QG673_1035, partial [Pseudomonadota bacterium]|nr:hypothetical protein [Pseudomonadota bacterium]